MDSSILYCGDTDLNGAAAYLAGMLTTWDWKFEYLPSSQVMTAEILDRPHSLIILSDYPSQQFPTDLQQAAARQIEQGCGLLMIGGWESFHGLGGDWESTPLGSILPVEITSRDDRMNFDQSAWLAPTAAHPVLEGLPWATRPPAIGGMNRVTAKPAAQTLLEAQTVAVSRTGLSEKSANTNPGWSFSAADKFPALVVGQAGVGRTAAFMSDIAPHWVGGFVDWGLPRVTGQAAGAGGIEVGHDYAQFWKQLLTWTGKLA